MLGCSPLAQRRVLLGLSETETYNKPTKQAAAGIGTCWRGRAGLNLLYPREYLDAPSAVADGCGGSHHCGIPSWFTARTIAGFPVGAAARTIAAAAPQTLRRS